jgi:hypothetical protein
MPTLLTNLILALCCATAVSSPAPEDWARATASKPFHHYTLLSWKLPSGDWRFSLKEGDQVDKSVKTMAQFQMTGFSALKRKLRQLPTGAHINWSKFRALGFDYPPAEKVEEMQHFTERLGIYLYFNFVTEE